MVIDLATGEEWDPFLDKETVLQCPGCERWQLHYTVRSVLDLVEYTIGPDGVIPHSEQIDALMETFMRDHVLRCPGIGRINALWKSKGRPA